MLFRPAVILALVFVSNVSAQSPAEIHQSIRRSLEDRNYTVALKSLLEMQSRDPLQFATNNYDYLVGRLSEKIGDTALAMASFQGVVNRNSVLKEYALWHLARGARASGNLMLERLYLRELNSLYPKSLLVFPVDRRLSESWFESGNYDLAIRNLELRRASSNRQVGESIATSTRRKNVALLAEAYLRSGNTAKARELFSSLKNDLPNPAQPDDHALASVLALDATEASQQPVTLDDREHLDRGSIYQFDRDFDHARSHFAAIVTAHPTSELVADALFQIGRGYAQERDFTEALHWFERLLEQFPDHPIRQETLLQAASAYARLGKYRESVTRYRKYIELYPAGERIDRAYLNIIDVLRDQREEIEALKWAATIRERFKGAQPAALATFAEAKIYLARTDWENALSALDRLRSYSDLGGGTAPGGTTSNEVHFLRAYALEQLHRYDEAIDAYLAVPDGRGEFHGARANERLSLLSQNEGAMEERRRRLRTTNASDAEAMRRDLAAALRLTFDRDERATLLTSLRNSYATVPGNPTVTKFKFLEIGRQGPIEPSTKSSQPARPRNVADELLFLGLYDEAAPEVEVNGATLDGTRNTRSAGKMDLEYTVAVLYTRGDMAYRGVAFAESSWKAGPDLPIELIPDEIAELLFPAPYEDSLLTNASPRNLDPRLLLSVMRQESRFRPDVKSVAAARGLMQFISTTSSRVAAELGREDFQQDDLYDPTTAILFGSHYLENLFKLFPGQPAAVVASYNAGDDNMQRWLARSKADQADRYVPEIAFSQTKDYVWRVLANYRMYRMLYDESLNRTQVRPPGGSSVQPGTAPER